MKLSLYTSVRNGLYFDYHVVEMVKHPLPWFFSDFSGICPEWGIF